MTNTYALDGPWEGLRAIPRNLATPTHRKRLENGLERLGNLYEQMARRAALLHTGMERLNGLAAGMISQLDAIDGDVDLEPSLSALTPTVFDRWGSQENWLVGPDDDREQDSGEREPSLCGVTCSLVHALAGAHDAEQEHDGREPDVDREASLSGTLGTYAHAVGPGESGIGSLGEITWDLEGHCEDEGHDSDREPEDGQ